MSQDTNSLQQKERKVGVYDKPAGPAISLPLLVVIILIALALLYFFFLR